MQIALRGGKIAKNIADAIPTFDLLSDLALH